MTREDKLIMRMKQGDLHAAEELTELLYPEILRYCLWHAPSRELAEDAAQETFLKAMRYYDRYIHKGKLRPFLYRIAANTCIDLRRKSTELSIEDLCTEPACEDSNMQAVQADLTFRQQIQCLPQEQQEVVLLRFGQDLTLREIAQITEAPLRTVQSRLRAALKKLKLQLEQEAAL